MIINKPPECANCVFIDRQISDGPCCACSALNSRFSYFAPKEPSPKTIMEQTCITCEYGNLGSMENPCYGCKPITRTHLSGWVIRDDLKIKEENIDVD